MAAMGGLLSLVNRLQQVCTLLGDNAVSDRSLPSLWDVLPSIVVVGGQSSGKSSVLESVVGRDFLPRGSGIVTRRPLVLQLTQGEPGSEEWGEFLHQKGKRFTSFEEMRQEIEAETARSCGSGKTVIPDPINLSVTSPNVPNLTLVDMPGLTKIAVEGQPKSIVKDIEDMARFYVQGQNAIILAVSPANADIATSDAIRLAREVDPAGERTVGVLTKLDIMDRGTNARAVLEGHQVPLRHGWIAVVNRAQADLDGNMSMTEARRREAEFFSSRHEYHGLKNVGMEALTAKLTKKLEEAIVRQIPVIQSTISEGVQTIQKELKSYGSSVPDNRGAMVHEVLTLCRAFEADFCHLLDGGEGGGEAILSIFETDLTKAIQELPFQEVYSLKNVARVIDEADGYQPHLIAPEMGYRRLIERGLALLRAPSEAIVDKVYLVLRGMVDTLLAEKAGAEAGGLSRYGVLKAEIASQAARELERMRDSTKEMVVTMVEMEASYLTAEFFREIIAQEAAAGQRAAGEDAHLKQIASHVSKYLRVVCNQLKATIPKAIVHRLVARAKTSLLDTFLEEVAGLQDTGLNNLLSEDESIKKRRELCQRRLEMLTRASREINTALGRAL